MLSSILSRKNSKQVVPQPETATAPATADAGCQCELLQPSPGAEEAPLRSVDSQSSLGAPEKPPDLAKPHEVTPSMRERQRRDPAQWSLSMQQWLNVLWHCTELNEYQRTKKQKGFVNMYDLVNMFVKPWTAGTGCGLAVLASRESEVVAKIMLSHAWGEDVEETLQCVQKYFEDNKISFSVPLWFCCFANYQPGDGFGPSIQEQLKLEPFAKVISAEELRTKNGGFGLLAVHTSREDLYNRLWCVHEVDRAIELEDLVVAAAMSDKYTRETIRRVRLFLDQEARVDEWIEAADIRVNTIRARCGNPDDERMLIQVVRERDGGFKRLDKVISDFRKDIIPREVMLLAVKQEAAALAHAPEKLKADREVVSAAVRQDGLALEHASEDLRADFQVVMAAVRQNGLALQFAVELSKDREIVMAAVEQCGGKAALQFAANELKQDPSAATAARHKALIEALQEAVAAANEAVEKQNEGIHLPVAGYFICPNHSECTGQREDGCHRFFVYDVLKSYSINVEVRVAYLEFPAALLSQRDVRLCLRVHREVGPLPGVAQAVDIAVTESIAPLTVDHDASLKRLPRRLSGQVQWRISAGAGEKQVELTELLLSDDLAKKVGAAETFGIELFPREGTLFACHSSHWLARDRDGKAKIIEVDASKRAAIVVKQLDA